MAAPPKSKAGKVAALSALALLLALAAFFGFRALNPTNRGGESPGGGRLVNAAGQVGPGGDLTKREGRVGNVGDLSKKTGQVNADVKPTDVIDYLEFLKEVERRRISLSKKEIGKLLEATATIPGGNLKALMETDEASISSKLNQNYSGFQDTISGFQKDWNDVSAFFLTKKPPQSCQKLADKYYDALGKTSSGITKAGNAFSQALSGDASKALDALSGMRGAESDAIDRACNEADQELATVCDKFRIHKSFDIKPEGGGANLFGGIGGGL
jgi:hypothetical protein